MPDQEARHLTFRCPAELFDILPPPVPATLGVPDWIKKMPPQAFNGINQRDEDTVKRCPPFIDAMTHGFLIPLMCDLRVENGEFVWDNEIAPSQKLACVYLSSTSGGLRPAISTRQRLMRAAKSSSAIVDEPGRAAVQPTDGSSSSNCRSSRRWSRCRCARRYSS